MKICSQCFIEKDELEFYFIKKRNVYESACKICRKKAVKKYLDSHDNLKKIFNVRVRNIRNRSKLKVDDDLRDYLIDIWNKQNQCCYYTGIKMVMKGYSSNINNVATIDRIDSSIGYEKNNVVLCCSIVNKIKQNLTIDELIDWCDKIKEFRKMDGLL